MLGVHDGEHGGDAIEHALDVDVDHPVPLLDLQRGHQRQRHDAGIVDEDVDAAELGNSGIDEGLHVGAVGDIERSRYHDTTSGTDFLAQSVQTVGSARADDEFRTGETQFAGRGGADAAAGASDQHYLVVHIGHALLLK